MSAADPFAPGGRFGRYEIVRLVGSGAMGKVYEAVMVDLHKRVALKTLSEQLASNKDALERFLREGRAAARIRHSNVVSIFDVGIEAGVPFLAMEFLEGQDLAARFEQGPMAVHELLEIMLPVIFAVAAAHDVGVIHRDIKPANIFLSHELGGVIRPMVVDFGVSKLNDSSVHLTQTASLMGTPLYMSPEQANGARDVDGRTDQYSLGVVLYEGVTGRVPYEVMSLLELASKLSAGAYPKPCELRPELDPGLEAVILRAMSSDAQQRFPSLYELGSALVPFAQPLTQSKWSAIFAASHGASLQSRARGVQGSSVSAGALSPPAGPLAAAHSATVHSSQVQAASAAASPEVAPASELPISIDMATQAAVADAGVADSELDKQHPPLASDPNLSESTFGRSVASITQSPERRRPAPTRWVLVGFAAVATLLGAWALWGSSNDESAAAEALEHAAENYVVKLHVTPSDAQIILDDIVVGHGDLSTRLPLDGELHTIELVREGYASQSLTFRDAPPRENVELRKLEQPVVSVETAPEPSAAAEAEAEAAPAPARAVAPARVKRQPKAASKPRPSQGRSADKTAPRREDPAGRSTPNNAPILY